MPIIAGGNVIQSKGNVEASKYGKIYNIIKCVAYYNACALFFRMEELPFQ